MSIPDRLLRRLGDPPAEGTTDVTHRNQAQEHHRNGSTKRINRGLVLALACGAQAMVGLDTAIVNVALPSIQRDLGVSHSTLQWVVVAYGLLLGGFFLLAGVRRRPHRTSGAVAARRHLRRGTGTRSRRRHLRGPVRRVPGSLRAGVRLVETMREIGGAAGVAAVSTVLVAGTGLDGFHAAFAFIAVLAVTGVVIAAAGFVRTAAAAPRI